MRLPYISALHQELWSYASCVLDDPDDIVYDMTTAPAEDKSKQISDIIDRAIARCNEQTTSLWQYFWGALRGDLYGVQDRLRRDYLLRARLFWKRLSVVQTCR